MKNIFKYLFVLVFLLNGCADYPIKKDNILGQPVSFKFKTEFNPDEPKEQYVENVMSNFTGLDDIAHKELNKYVSGIYDERIGKSNLKFDNKYVGDLLVKSISNNPYDLFKYIYSYRPTWKISNDINGNSNVLNGTVNFSSARGRWVNVYGENYVSSDVSIVFRGNYQHNNGVMSGQISDVNYLINCVNEKRGPEVVPVIRIKDDMLISAVRNFTKYVPKQYYDEITKAAKEHLEKRYTKLHGVSSKKEKKYKVDFATAKARLQRALGAFKYDNERSSFLFEKSYNLDKHSINHKYVVALFPDRNNTVIEFSGEYDYLKDIFSGKILFDQADYQQEMEKYISQVDKLLK